MMLSFRLPLTVFVSPGRCWQSIAAGGNPGIADRAVCGVPKQDGNCGTADRKRVHGAAIAGMHYIGMA
jgi:hypothetical protein